MKIIYPLGILFMGFVYAKSYAVDLTPCQQMLYGIQGSICIKKINEYEFHTEQSGRITIIVPGKIKKPINVKLPTNFYIQEVLIEHYKNNFYFTFGISDDESASSILASFDTRLLNFIWQVPAGSFNPDKPLVEVNYIYVTSIGTIAKFNRISGSVIWKHSGLYERETQAYNSFIKPRRKGDSIIFEEDKVSAATYEGIRKVVVDDRTGNITSK